ncbi:MAG: M20/M25/M40 family metallo-hydrolase [Gemmatimonadaceae bacterium]
MRSVTKFDRSIMQTANRRTSRWLSPLVLTFALPATLAAQKQITGYSPSTSAEQRNVEGAVIKGPLGTRARELSKALSKEPHVAGTPAQARTRDYVIAQMKAMGIETEARTYDVWLPHATSVHVWRMGNDVLDLKLVEPPIPGDEVTSLPPYPTVNGSSGAGVAEGEMVFVNYGLIEDYAVLDSLKVSVKGKVVLARYGRSFRGIKAREAQKRGAVALLIYTDPADDGFARGDVYPDGPMRPMEGVQRGSVYNGTGDPLTPGYASKPGAPRLPVLQAGLPTIPVVPISAANATILMKDMKGTNIPNGWQGGMAMRYHVGPGPTLVKVDVKTDEATAGTKQIFDTFGIIRGSEFPNEYVYIGGHRDGWGPGAADNVSGVISVLESAKSVSDLLKTGWKPKRTIVFATWDAEEWGMVGSTEYVEDDSLKLMQGAVAYFNQDVAAQGSSFGGSGTPSLRPVLRDVLKAVPDPRGKGSVYDAWRIASAVKDTAEPPMGDPGGGSDFAGFYNHLGIPIAEWGFGGPAGTYHSTYDTFAWMDKFGDPGFNYHATAARIGSAMVVRMADADILPYDYSEFAKTMRRYLPAMTKGFQDKKWDASAIAPLGAAIDKLQAAANQFAIARDAALKGTLSKATRENTNKSLLKVERAFTRPAGLKGRPWYRSLIYVADVDNGYSNMNFPGVNEAVRAGDAAGAKAEVADLVKRFGTATAAIDEARRRLAQK